MAQTTGRAAFLELLKQEGVSHLFGNPGTTELPIMDALAQYPEVRYVLGLQEAVVVTMAEGYARATGSLTVANVHVAPGLGNAMGALYGAKRARVPLIVTAGQQEQGLGVMEPLLYDSMVPMAAPLVKWGTEITRIEDLPRILHRAAKVALTPPRGPVFLSLPGDVLNASAELDLGAPTRINSCVLPPAEVLEQLAVYLLEATAPLIMAGSEVAADDAMAELAAVADLIGAPVYTQSVSYAAAFPSEHPLFMGELTRNQPRIRKVLEPADLLISAGADVLTLSVPNPVEPMPPGLPVVHLGQNDWEMGKNYPAEHAIRAHLKPTLRALAETLRQKRTAAQAETAAARRRELAPHNWSADRQRRRAALAQHAHDTPIEPEYLMGCLADALPDDAVVVDEGLTTTRTLQNHIAISDRNRYHGLCSGGIGWGLPGAVGVQLGLPQRKVVCISGDGSALYTVQALWSAAHEQLPIAFIICNNGSYRILKERLFAYGGEAVARENFIGMDLDQPRIDFQGLGQSLGLPSRTIRTPADLPEGLAWALQALEGPRLLDIRVARGFKP